MRGNYNCFIFILIVSLLMFACDNVQKSNTHYINGFKYNDPSYQEEIIAELKKNNIPIIISNDGFASYPNDYIGKVDELLKELDNRPYSEFYEKKHANNFVELLEKNNYEYRVKYLEGNKTQVYWNKEDDKFVRALKEKNLNNIFER